MKSILACTAMLLAGCASDEILLRPVPAAVEPAAEVTVIRPHSIVQQEWPFYIVVADQPVFDLRNGERTRFRISSGRQALVIRCGSAISKPHDVRIEHDFAPGGEAYFIVEPKGECAAIRSVDARGAAGDLRTTRFRAIGAVNPMAQATGDAPAAFSSAAAAPAAAAAGPNQQIAAASAAWIEAFNSRDVARLASLYDADAVLRDASGQRIAAGPGAIAGYLRTATPPSLGEQEIRVFGDTAVASSKSHNIVYRNRGGKWLIVDHNISAAK
jgi:ketosteroid isomerase-like protein